MDDLIAFLTARLDERERAARDALEQVALRLPGGDPSFIGQWHVATRPTTGSFVATCDQHYRDTEIVPLYGKAYGEHIAYNDPVYVLNDIAAKRQIIESHQSLWRDGISPEHLRPSCKTCSSEVEGWPCSTLRLLALPFASHPDYRENWRP